MAKSKEEKTNVMRTLEQKKLPYTAHTYDPAGPIDGVSVAQTLGQHRHGLLPHRLCRFFHNCDLLVAKL